MNETNPNRPPEPALPERRSAWIIVVAIAVVGLAVLAADWYMRFDYFRWQDFVMHQNKKVLVAGPAPPMIERTQPAHSGGDLTALTGLPEFNRAFEQPRPETTLVTDEFGYRNTPPTTNRYYPVVVLGDSFMYNGYPASNMFSEVLSAKANVPVYNYAYPGRGPFWSLSRFLNERRFEDRMPKVLVWGIIERDISGEAFAGMAFQVWRFLEPEKASEEKPTPDGVNWDYLSPAELKSNLPNTSFLAAFSKRLWNKIRYLAFGQVTDDVIVSEPSSTGERTLFYRLSLEAMKWPSAVRDPEKVAWAVDYLNQYCMKQGIHLCLVLIPDKAQVYRDLLPPPWNGLDIPASCLPEIENLLDDQDLTVINLLDVFRAQAGAELDLYWKDDTHWKPGAVRLAVEKVWPAIQPEVKGEQ